MMRRLEGCIEQDGLNMSIMFEGRIEQYKNVRRTERTG